MPEPYRIRVSTERTDPAWDQLVLAVGTYQQSCAWAIARTTLGWRMGRVVLEADGQLIGGAQIGLRPLFPAAARCCPLWVGYVPAAPIFVPPVEPEWVQGVLAAIERLAWQMGALAVLLIPPANAPHVRMQVAQSGWRLSLVAPAPLATTCVALDQPPAQLLRRMRKTTRYNVHVGARRGLEVRAGTAADLPTLYALLQATSQRKQFPLEPLTYYQSLWAAFAERAWLMLALYQQQPQAALLHVAWGDTVTYLAGGWAGTHPQLCPNDALHWASIQRAQAAGYRWYDLHGIDRATAQARLRGMAVTSPDPVYAFKLGYGGDVRVLPDSYVRVLPSHLHAAYAWFQPWLGRRRMEHE